MLPRDGSWNLQNAQFISSKQVHSWGCVWFRDRMLNPRKVEVLISKLKKSTADCGIEGISEKNLVSNPRCIANANDDFKRTMDDWMRRTSGKLDFILCLIPGNRPEIYGSIKTTCDLDYQVPTQCMQIKNIDKANHQFLANLALKINAKLGGTNNTINRSELLNKPTIVFGADVTHPGIGDHTSPSVAAIVGSANIEMSHYFHAIRIQEHRKEIIQDLQSVVKTMMLSFYRKLRRKPERIIFYRDGVSEGQFNDVIREELTAIEKACRSIEEGYRPAITFLVVQKRHHTRFFPSQNKDSVGKARNVPPGLVVDRGVCHPSQFDFYLCSHFGIQGTSRPTHYHVLLDENKLSADSLQEFTYQLCHVYCRCTRSVSIPAPVYYSHHLAFRARSYITQLGGEMSPQEMNRKIEQVLSKNIGGAVFFA
ncbi:Protein argonaute-2 [Trichoplax sp. H2]|nr:Protein argonaute-2 [Trichoplax sp. H2]|eukprot:RDD36036.1 Protein argonaute-2 [Trichoplax sp. H2]